MRRGIALFLLSTLLTCSLAGCGTRDSQQDKETDTNRPKTVEPRTGDQSPRKQDGHTGEKLMEDGRRVGDALEDGVRDSVDGVRNGVEDLVDPQDKKPGKVGASYDQMKDNAKVHDNDGFLKDHENAVTPGASRMG